MYLLIDPITGAAIVTGLGSLIGSAFNRGGSRKAIDRQNEYNSPKNQLQRIREAGLPYAAMTNGISGNQSEVQETSSGVGEAIQGGIETYVQTTMQKKQLEAINKDIELKQAQIDATNAGTDNTKVKTMTDTVNYDLLKDKATYELGSGDGSIQPLGSSNQIGNAVREQELRKANTYLAQNHSKAAQLEMDIKSAKNPLEMEEIRTRIQAMITDMGIKVEDLKIRQRRSPLEMGEIEQRTANMKLEAGLFPLREHQMVLHNRMSYHQTQLNGITDTLIDGMKQGGMTITEAFFHTLFNNKMNFAPINFNER